jgi:hypothetical protein
MPSLNSRDSKVTVKDFSVNLSVGRVQVLIENYKGIAIFSKSIVIPPANTREKDYLDSVIHETIHISRPDLKEHAVEVLASDIAEVLWKRGYRIKK